MKNFGGVVFDFDGVVVDSEKHWSDIENPYLHEHIPKWKDQYYNSLIGRSLPEVYSYLKHTYNFPIPASQYFKDYESMALTLYRERARALPDLIELLDYLQSVSSPLSIASSSKRNWINLALDTNKLVDYFGVIVSAHDKFIQQGKPAPDVYLSAALIMRQSPRELLAIEDSKNGVTSAKSAGLICVGLRNGFNNEQDLGEADFIAEGHAEVLKIIKNWGGCNYEEILWRCCYER